MSLTPPNAIELMEVTKFRGTQCVLRNVSAQIPRGQVVAVLGPFGRRQVHAAALRDPPGEPSTAEARSSSVETGETTPAFNPLHQTTKDQATREHRRGAQRTACFAICACSTT
ncbi:MAG: hypothetical protein U5N23_10795 [Acidovorax sp.]|nr:hypothetical protein [Acidovorax sp.]MDZ7863258.1 hypothetical protein [Acidovorax sp.]